jgi:GAF domain-containing protein
MCGCVIRGRVDPELPFFTRGGSFWTNSTTELLDDDRLIRTRNTCNSEGYESVALVPLRKGEQTFGLIQLNDRHRDRFTPEMIELLEELSGFVAGMLA